MTQIPLTALERELLGYVEQLACASKTSATVLRDFEQQSGNSMERRLTNLESQMLRIADSQRLFVNALSAWVGGSMTHEAIQTQLNESSQKLKTVERQLQQDEEKLAKT